MFGLLVQPSCGGDRGVVLVGIWCHSRSCIISRYRSICCLGDGASVCIHCRQGYCKSFCRRRGCWLLFYLELLRRGLSCCQSRKGRKRNGCRGRMERGSGQLNQSGPLLLVGRWWRSSDKFCLPKYQRESYRLGAPGCSLLTGHLLPLSLYFSGSIQMGLDCCF